VAQKLEEMLHLGLAQGATEVHLEPTPEHTRVRFRVQGKMVDHSETIDAKLHPKIVSRTKVIGLMDISKRGIAQRGYGKIEHEGQSYEMSMHIVPTSLGEKALYRISWTHALSVSLEQLGMFPKILAAFKKLLDRPNGMILFAGPPGSGRTTTAYTAINHLNQPDRSVCTFEPAIRYQIPGVTQGKPEERYNYTFLDGVRATLELEPDVMYIGEINSEEIARLALGAAFGKRIVLARLNAKNGSTALMQLLDMGLPGFLVASGVIGVLTQRLVRRLCDKCREPYTPQEMVLKELGFKPSAELNFYTSKGCAECENSGFKGKLGIFELFIPSEKVQERVISRASAAEIQEAAAETGMMALRVDGISKVSRGLTTLEEILASS
jgi:type IV pilus assembly protein PilB